jgi:hypothetical protein
VNGYAACSSGTCGLACNAGYTLCGGACKNLSADPSNCGTCGHVCPASTPTCSGGTCVCQAQTCASLGLACGSTSDGCGHTLNCGTCPSGKTCCGGVCQANQCFGPVTGGN